MPTHVFRMQDDDIIHITNGPEMEYTLRPDGGLHIRKAEKFRAPPVKVNKPRKKMSAAKEWLICASQLWPNGFTWTQGRKLFAAITGCNKPVKGKMSLKGPNWAGQDMTYNHLLGGLIKGYALKKIRLRNPGAGPGGPRRGKYFVMKPDFNGPFYTTIPHRYLP